LNISTNETDPDAQNNRLVKQNKSLEIQCRDCQDQRTPHCFQLPKIRPMTGKMRHATNHIIEHVNELSDDEYASFMDDLICNLEVDLNPEDEDRDF
jgi:hypothetical protein